MTGQGWTVRTRLLVAQVVVVGAGILTAALVAVLVGPSLFHRHLLQAGQTPHSPELEHIEQAYRDANTIALGSAFVIALGLGVAVTWYLSRRMTQPLTELAGVATRLSDGDYTARAVRRSGPELDRLAGTFNEVAERLQTTEQTRRRLLADLAHEMRTPLAVIEAYLDGLDDGMTDWTPQTARVLRDHTDRLVRLSDDVAEVSRAEEGRLDLQLERVEVGELLATATRGVEAGYRSKQVALVVTGRDGAGPLVGVDRQRLLQLLTNLLTNALRHTPSGGTVTVAAHHSSSESGCDTVDVSVTDTGHGIPAEQLDHVFERFYRGDSARDRDHGGSGIGLAIARSIAHAHHGTLAATSAGPGRGASFTLRLPVTD